jgi:peptidoglycan/xylan/chitin deacetylase (PgdA/CDA1 family)
MLKLINKIIRRSLIIAGVIGIGAALFTIFFDQAILVRKGTIYRVNEKEKLVALTFDDGPSDIWTPKILNELKAAGVKATFFMLGEHVEKYPEVARRVAREGHEIGNHSYSHGALIYYTKDELKLTIKKAEEAIEKATGVTTKYFRPPKAWLSKREKKKIKEMGYEIILWSLNSKDWVNFDDKYIIRYLVRNVRPGDIILFHDSGGFFDIEGGNRWETVLAVPRLIEKLREKGYKFVTISELLSRQSNTK